MSDYVQSPNIQETMLKLSQGNQRNLARESAASFWKNITKGVQDSTKGALTLDSGRRVGIGTFKASKDFAKGDVVCGSLCCVSIGCEAVSSIIVWLPMPGKIVTISALKATSIGCQKFRDLCVVDPSSPLC